MPSGSHRHVRVHVGAHTHITQAHKVVFNNTAGLLSSSFWKRFPSWFHLLCRWRVESRPSIVLKAITRAFRKCVLSNWSHSSNKHKTQPGGAGRRLASSECRLLGSLINVRVQSGRHGLVPSNDPVLGVSLLMHFLWAGKTRRSLFSIYILCCPMSPPRLGFALHFPQSLAQW